MTLALSLVARSPAHGHPPLGDWQLARALSSRCALTYVDPPRPVHRPSPQATSSERDVPSARIRPWSLPGADRRWTAPLSDWAVTRQLDRVLPTGPRVVIVSDPRRGPLTGLRSDLTVYWRRDRFTAHEGRVRDATHLARRDRALMRESDLVLGVSPLLVEDARSLGTEAAWIPNGVDLAHFASAPLRPRDRRSGRPRVGFVGGLSWRVDVELLDLVAVTHPEWDVVLHGPLAPGVRLPARPNLHAHGPVDYDDLPEVMSRLDVGLVPYVDDPFNRASYPLKVFEYLAVGTPVVSTGIPALAGLTPCVRTSDDRGGFLAAVEDVVDHGVDPSTCREMASENGWDDRAARVLATLSEHLL